MKAIFGLLILLLIAGASHACNGVATVAQQTVTQQTITTTHMITTITSAPVTTVQTFMAPVAPRATIYRGRRMVIRVR